MSDNNLSPLAPSTPSETSTLSEMLLLLNISLENCMKHPDTISSEWIDTIADFKNSPCKVATPLYDNSSLHFADCDDNVLLIAFPAILIILKKYTRIGPYLNIVKNKRNLPVLRTRHVSSPCYSNLHFLVGSCHICVDML